MATVIGEEIRDEEGYVIEPFGWTEMTRARVAGAACAGMRDNYPEGNPEFQVWLPQDNEPFLKLQIDGMTWSHRDIFKGYGCWKFTARLERIGEPKESKGGWLVKYRASFSNRKWVPKTDYS